MPLLWRYLLRSYFQVFGLCVSGFIAILLVIRFQEIARFASSGAPKLLIALFSAYQIPFILGYAVPIAALIAAMLLFQKLSHTHELTAFRAAGLGIKTIAFPLIVVGSLLTLFNFTIICEVAPRCRSLSKQLIGQMTAVNPLFLLQKDTMVKLKDAYIDMKVLHAGKYAEDVIVVVNNRTNGRLGLMTAKELSLEGELLNGSQVAFISSVDPKKGDDFDHLVIENQATMCTKASNLSPLIQTTDWQGNYDYLTLRMILAKDTYNKNRDHLSGGRAQIEIFRRASLALAALTFTFVGIAFGMEISRNRTKKGILWAIGLSASFMVCFVIAKSLRHSLFSAYLLFLLPHPLIILWSLRSLKQTSRGTE